jgi:hypothetical protein
MESGSAALSRSWSQAPDSNAWLAGIGLLMQQDLDPDASDGVGQNKVFIKSVVPGGACDRDGSIQVGDTVLSVNGENVVGLTVADIRERIVGPIGSQVSITLESGATGEIFERVLVRGNAQPAERVERLPVSTMRSSMDAPNVLSRSMDARHLHSLPPQVTSNDLEIHRQARRIMELESQLNITREEYQRTKALLDSDRNSSEKTVKEIDAIQRKNVQHIMELQNLLNKSEQARRELEIQVTNGKAREEEFHLAFSRAKEQTEAREEYFADLKAQFDEMRIAFDRDLHQAREEKAEAERKRMEAEAEKNRVVEEMKTIKSKELARREKELTVKQILNDTEHKLIELKQLEEKVRSQSQSLHLLFGQWHKDYFINKSKEEAELENYFLA